MVQGLSRFSIIVLFFYVIYSLAIAGGRANGDLFRVVLLLTSIVSVFITYAAFGRDGVLISPVPMVFASFALGVVIRGLWLMNFGVRQEEVLYGYSLNELVPGIILSLLGFILFAFGSWSKGSSVYVRIKQRVHLRKWRLLFLVMATLLIWLYAMSLLISKLGLQELALDSISDKRKMYDINGQRYSFGYVRILLRLPGYLFIYLYLFSKSKIFPKSTLLKVTQLLLLLVVVFTGVFTSSRTDILNVLFVWLIIGLVHGDIRMRQIVYMGGLVIIASLIIVYSRGNSSLGDSNVRIIDGIVGNNNLFGIVKNTAVYKHMYETNDYKYGTTLLSWLSAPIPREYWSNKPIINPGLVFRNEIMPVYSVNNDGGIPPSFVGELFWNFGVFGLFFCPLWGWSALRIYKSLREKIALGQLSRAAFLAYFYYTLTFRLSGESFTQLVLFSIEAFCLIGFINIFKFYYDESITYN